MPVAGRDFNRFGGRTTSFVISAGETTVILDAGTGITAAAGLGTGGHWDILLSHYHHDHLQGLQFFAPVFAAGNAFTYRGLPPEGMSLANAIAATFEPPFFPVALADTPSTHSFVELEPGSFRLGDLSIDLAKLHHPQGVAGYRFSHDDYSIVVATDHEAGDPDGDAALEKLAAGADVLIHDAQYTPEDYEAHRGWGHSTWEDAVVAAEAAGVGRLVLTSHDPSRTDEDIEDIVTAARRRFPLVEAAHQGMVISA